MTLVWTVLFGVLVAEIAVVLVLLLPLPARVHGALVRPYVTFRLAGHDVARTAFVVLVALLLAAFTTSVADVAKENGHLAHAKTLARGAQDDSVLRVERSMFRAQRNLYISGFSLLLLLVAHRLAHLLHERAQAQAAAAESKKRD